MTRDGSDSRPYRSPSQADDGTIAASHGNDIVRLRQNGQVLSRFDPPGDHRLGRPVHRRRPGGRVAVARRAHGGVHLLPVRLPRGARRAARARSRCTRTRTAPRRSHSSAGSIRRNPSWVSNAVALHLQRLPEPGELRLARRRRRRRRALVRRPGPAARRRPTSATVSCPARATAWCCCAAMAPTPAWQFYKVNGNAVGGSPTLPSEACFSGADGSLDGRPGRPDGVRRGVRRRAPASRRCRCPPSSRATAPARAPAARDPRRLAARLRPRRGEPGPAPERAGGRRQGRRLQGQEAGSESCQKLKARSAGSASDVRAAEEVLEAQDQEGPPGLRAQGKEGLPVGDRSGAHPLEVLLHFGG